MQVEIHPHWRNDELREYCNSEGIHVSAYCPLGIHHMQCIESICCLTSSCLPLLPCTFFFYYNPGEEEMELFWLRFHHMPFTFCACRHAFHLCQGSHKAGTKRLLGEDLTTVLFSPLLTTTALPVPKTFTESLHWRDAAVC